MELVAKIFCCFYALIITVSCRTIFYELTASYFDGAPDGVPKKILGFNNQFPGPTLRGSKGDWLRIKVNNQIQDGQTTTIHWHGLEQFLSPWQDGPRMLTQCDIPYNHSFTYEFELLQSGSYWYHSHHTSQYAEGLWGVLIVDNTPAEIHAYDGEFVLTLSDWFHLPSKQMSEWYEDGGLSRGGLPFPDSSLLNGRGYYDCKFANLKGLSCNPSYATRYQVLEVERGKTYRFRIVNPSTIVLHIFQIHGHKLEAIETDGVDTGRVTGVDRVTVSTGTRYSFLVKMDGNLDQYWIQSTADLLPYKTDYPNINPYPEAYKADPTMLAVLKYVDTNATALLSPSSINPNAVQGRPEIRNFPLLQSLLDARSVKAPSEPILDGFTLYPKDPLNLPYATAPYPTTVELDSPTTLNYMDCVPVGGEEAPNFVNQTIIISIPDIDHPDSIHKVGFNDVKYDPSFLDKPGLVKMILNETLPDSVQPITINGFGDDYVVELIISDYGDSGHPLHLHGHTFWVMGYGKGEEGPFNETHHRPILRSGVRKETMAVQPRSWLVIRFRANNPGLWLFHCHMNFHFESAMGLVLVEGGDIVKDLYPLPKDMVNLCKLSGIDLAEKSSSNLVMSNLEFLVVFSLLNTVMMLHGLFLVS